MLSRSVFLILFLVFGISASYADLSSDLVLSLPTQDLNQILKEADLEFEVQDQNLELGEGFDLDGAAFSGVSFSTALSLHPQIDSYRSLLGGEVDLKKLSLSLADFKYNSILEIKRPGLNAKIHVNVACTSLNLNFLNWSASFASFLGLKKGNLVLDKGDLVLIGDQIQVDLSTCKSPRGVESIFADKIRELLGKKSVSKLIYKEAKKVAEEKVNKLIKDQLKKIPFETLNLDLKTLRFSKEKIILRARAVIKSDLDRDFYLPESLNLETNQSQIFFPKKVLAVALPEILKNFKVSVLRKQIPGVGFLFNNRLIQFFVWSDLLNFRTDSNFKIDLSFSQSQLKYKGFNPDHQQFIYDVQGSPFAEMSFLNSHDHVFPYINFYGRAQGRAGISINDKGLEITLGKGDLSLSSSWSSKMKRWRKSKATSLPWMSVILGQIKKAIFNQVFHFKWSDLLVGPFFENLKVEDQGDQFSLAFDLKTESIGN